jgi:hypothetical protein
MLPIFNIVLAIPLLFWGRRLFWLFIGAVGFLLGLSFASSLFPNQTGWTPILIALGIGILGALLTVMVQRAALWVGGFLAGAYLLTASLKLFSISSQYNFITFLVGGVIGAIIMMVMFDWALIILSSLTGAVLVAQVLPFNLVINIIIAAALFFVGLLVQFRNKDT